MANFEDNTTKRSVNFSAKEVELLVELVKKYNNVIDCKKTDAATWKQKKSAWNELCEEFNSRSGGVVRTTKNIRSKYENIKKCAKRKFAEEKQETYKTGGGSSKLVNITPVDVAIKEIIGVSCTGLEATCDSDAPIDFQSEKGAGSMTTNDSWKSWNPSMLRRPPSSPLVIYEEGEEGDLNITREETGKKRKANDLTSDCRRKYSKLSDARLELITMQKESAKQEMELRKEEHDTRMKHMKQEWALKEEKLKLEIMLLKKNLNSN